jgi:hypothetical protein
VPDKSAERGLWSWARSQWDADTGFVFNPPGGYHELGSLAGRHLIRETAWFALAALDHGETHTAARALTAVVARQYDRPGAAWHGTFPVFAHDPEPGPDAIEWYSYDANWRQFVGIALALILESYASVVPDEVRAACEASVVRCVEGEPPGRIVASYTNPALMHAWLARWVGDRHDRPDLTEQGDALASRIVERFARSGTVDEFNAPTYYGVDLVAATLWCRATDPTWRDRGRQIVNALLDELQFLYHPRLRALCGPFTRTYTLDLRAQVSLYGLWRLLALGDHGALPPLEGTIPHSHDLFFAPLADWARRATPRPFPTDDEQLPRQRSFTINGGRVVDARLDADVMVGAERGGGRGDYVWDQYVPGSVHWLERDDVRWVAVQGQAGCPVDCTLITPRGLLVEPAPDANRPVRVRTNAPIEQLGNNRLGLGERVQIDSDGPLAVDETRAGRPVIVAGTPGRAGRLEVRAS